MSIVVCVPSAPGFALQHRLTTEENLHASNRPSAGLLARLSQQSVLRLSCCFSGWHVVRPERDFNGAHLQICLE
jgi:hypothetical protein